MAKNKQVDLEDYPEAKPPIVEKPPFDPAFDDPDLKPEYAPQHMFYSMFVPHLPVHAPISGDSLTRQEFAAECDVNNLMARYEKTGMFPQVEREPRYMNLVGVPDFHAAMQLVIDAEAAFMSLPATVRREFDNDPGRFVEFAQDKENLPQMREWGLAPPLPKEDVGPDIGPKPKETPKAGPTQ